jgi:hypothetical protein
VFTPSTSRAARLSCFALSSHIRLLTRICAMRPPATRKCSCLSHPAPCIARESSEISLILINSELEELRYTTPSAPSLTNAQQILRQEIGSAALRHAGNRRGFEGKTAPGGRHPLVRLFASPDVTETGLFEQLCCASVHFDGGQMQKLGGFHCAPGCTRTSICTEREGEGGGEVRGWQLIGELARDGCRCQSATTMRPSLSMAMPP